MHSKSNVGGAAFTTRDPFMETADSLIPELSGNDSSFSLLRRPGSGANNGNNNHHRESPDDFKYHVSGDKHGNNNNNSGAGGTGGASMMDTEDVLIRTEAALRWYNPVAYAWLMLPSVDLIDIMVMKGVVPRDHPQTHIARWFAAPEDVIYYPGALKDILGAERYNVVAPEFTKLLEDYEKGVSPLVRALNKHPEVPRDIWIGLMRWMAVMASRAEAKDTILSLILAISNGQGPQSLQLPEMQQTRGAIVGDILIGAGAEYGAVSLAQLGVDLLLINGRSCTTFQDQKMLTVAFSRTSCRLMDWSVRCSGELLRCLPRWFALHIAQGHLKNANGKNNNNNNGSNGDINGVGHHDASSSADLPEGKKSAEQIRKTLAASSSSSSLGDEEQEDDQITDAPGDEVVDVVSGVSDLTNEEQQQIYEKMEEVRAGDGTGPRKRNRLSDAKLMEGVNGKKKQQQRQQKNLDANDADADAGEEEEEEFAAAPVSLVTDTERAQEERLVQSMGERSVFFSAADKKSKEQQQRQVQQKSVSASSSSSSSSSLVTPGDPTWRYFKSNEQHAQAHVDVRHELVEQSRKRREAIALARPKLGHILEKRKKKDNKLQKM